MACALGFIALRIALQQSWTKGAPTPPQLSVEALLSSAARTPTHRPLGHPLA